MKHHFDRGSDSDFCDPSGWNRASYESHPCDEIEPIDLAPNGYRQAAIYHLQIMLAIDEYVSAAEDARLAVIAVAVTLKWPSVRGLSVGNIAGQLGASATAIARACARFREMAGLGVSAGGGVRFVGNGAGSSNWRQAGCDRRA